MCSRTEIGEIIRASQREERLEILDTRMAEHGIDQVHYAPTLPSPASGRALRGTELDCMAGVVLNQNYARGHEPLSALQGGEGGARPQGWEGEVAAPQTGSSAPLTLPSPPGQRGERVKGASSEPRFGGKSSNSRSLHFPRIALRTAGEGSTRSEAGEGLAAGLGSTPARGGIKLLCSFCDFGHP
jgi:hypothetical protein